MSALVTSELPQRYRSAPCSVRVVLDIGPSAVLGTVRDEVLGAGRSAALRARATCRVLGQVLAVGEVFEMSALVPSELPQRYRLAACAARAALDAGRPAVLGVLRREVRGALRPVFGAVPDGMCGARPVFGAVRGEVLGAGRSASAWATFRVLGQVLGVGAEASVGRCSS